jgi:hypothetical protein
VGPLFTDNAHRMVGQDGGFSIPLSPGRTLWFFGDTLIGRRPPAGQSLWYIDGQPVGPRDMTGRGTFERMINNTALVLRHATGDRPLTDFQYITGGDHQLRALLPLIGGEHPDRDRIWCQHGLALPDGRVVLSFIKVGMLDHGPLPVNFTIVGSGLAIGSSDDWTFTRVRDHGDDILWTAAQPHFGVAFLRPRRDDGFIHVYGTVNESGTQNCYVARVPAGDVTRLGRYEYFGGVAWVRDLDAARPIFSGMPSELSVSYNAHLGAYLAVHSLDLTGKLVGRTSPNPWGPWSEPVTLWTVKPPQGLPYMPLIYAGKEHPELAADGGKRIYLTYIEFEEYFPHLVEVTLR